MDIKTVTPIFFAQAGANYIKSREPLNVQRERWGLLSPGTKYLKIGTKDRTSFTWSEPIEYHGTTKIQREKYVVFGITQHKGEYFCYAFPTVDEKTLLQFTNGMKGARDIKLDAVKVAKDTHDFTEWSNRDKKHRLEMRTSTNQEYIIRRFQDLADKKNRSDGPKTKRTDVIIQALVEVAKKKGIIPKDINANYLI